MTKARMAALTEVDRENTELGGLTAHLEALEARHRVLDQEEVELRQHVGARDEELLELGKRKLRVKDRIELVKSEITRMRAAMGGEQP